MHKWEKDDPIVTILPSIEIERMNGAPIEVYNKHK